MGVVTLTSRRIRSLPGTVRELVAAFRENDLLLFASAIAFQVLTAIVPLALFGLGLVAFLDLTELYDSDLRPKLAEQVDIPTFVVIDSTVERILGEKQIFWVTLGGALAVWQLSGAVRAAMDGLNRVHGVEERRTWKDRYPRSIALAVAGTVLVFAAAATIRLGPLLTGGPPFALAAVLFVVRWAVAAALLVLFVALLIHFGPDAADQPLGWVTFGAVLVIVIWLAMSALFWVYLTRIASYGSVFGFLASFVVLTGYLYASCVAFVAGVQLDALARD
jgi:membrane protein